MDIQIDYLALENWFDLLAFLSRAQLGQWAPRIGNRRFGTIVQHFLHKYVRQITLRPINLLETIHYGNEEGHSKARVIVWKSHRWGREEFPVADGPMPENIINFEAIHLSYLDMSVLHLLQKLEQKLMFTNVNVKITTKYTENAAKIMQCLFHLVPMIASVDSIELQGAGFFDLIIHKTGYRYYFAQCTKEQIAEYAQVATSMIYMARIIEISNQYSKMSYGWSQFDWLCHWLYTPRDDGKPRILILLQEYISPWHLPDFVELLKRDFLLSKEAVSYFIGIQNEPPWSPVNMETVTNCKTNEQIVCKQGRVQNWPPLLLISRYPLEAAQDWIDEYEKHILDRKVHNQGRRIELDGSHIGIGPMEMTNSPPPPTNRFKKFLSNLKKIAK